MGYELLNGCFVVEGNSKETGIEWRLSNVSERVCVSDDRSHRSVTANATLYSGRSHRLGERCCITLQPSMKLEKVTGRKNKKTESVNIDIPAPGWYPN